jgi:hypothetical protein
MEIEIGEAIVSSSWAGLRAVWLAGLPTQPSQVASGGQFGSNPNSELAKTTAETATRDRYQIVRFEVWQAWEKLCVLRRYTRITYFKIQSL